MPSPDPTLAELPLHPELQRKWFLPPPRRRCLPWWGWPLLAPVLLWGGILADEAVRQKASTGPAQDRLMRQEVQQP